MICDCSQQTIVRYLDRTAGTSYLACSSCGLEIDVDRPTQVEISITDIDEDGNAFLAACLCAAASILSAILVLTVLWLGYL